MTALESIQVSLEDELAEVCGHLNVLHARMVSLTRSALETQAWSGQGINTPAQWLAWQTGLSPERAKQIVRLAEREVELPVTYAAFGDGLVSVDQMVAVAKRTPAHNDAEACDLAQAATVAQLRVALGKAFFPPAPKPADDDAPSPEPPAREHSLSVGFNDDGDLSLHALVDAVDGALIYQGLKEARDALFAAGNKDVTWLDALVEMARRSLASVESPSRRDLYRIIVHLDAEGAWVHQGPHLPPALADYILCDGVVQPLWHSEGLPINLGRAVHIVPLRTRRVVEDRDRVCRNPMCNSSHGLQVHHIIHWDPDGPSDTWNLCCLCPSCHRRHHRGEFTIEGNADDPDGLVFRNKHGTIIAGAAPPKPPNRQPPPASAKRYVHPEGGSIDYDYLTFRPAPSNPPDSN